MRYTEARLQKLTMHLLDGIDKDTVDFYPNFDETLQQPSVLPARFPNLLVNGSSGIAVGMATNIPPHNLTEVINGVICMIDNPDCTVEDLMQHIKGPDFPTGGLIMGRSGIREAYQTGHGRITVRAKSNVEEMGNGRSRIVVTEIPYQVNKSVLVKKVADLVHEKKIEGISDIRDESNDRQGMRIVIELKRDVQPQVVLNMLYKHTPMQENFGANMLALVDGKPRVLNLRDMIYYYLEHQKEVVTRRTRFELNKAQERAHILEGLLKALDHIDEIVAIIRASKDTAAARDALMLRFEFSEKQAQAILDMRLARLTGLERERLQEEYAELEKTIAYLRAVLGDEKLVLGIIRDEILQIKAKYADERRTAISMAEGEIDPEDLIQEDNVVITLTHRGYVKRIPRTTYRSQHRGGKGIMGMTTHEEDYAERLLVTSTHDDILFFTDRGRVYKLKGYEIPEAGRTAKGTAIVNLLQLSGGEKITAMIPLPREQEGYNLVMATRGGITKKTPLSEFANLRKAGLIAIVLREDDEMIGVELTRGGDELMLATRQGQTLRCSESEFRTMGRNSMGVRGMRMDEGDELISLEKVAPGKQVVTITENGFGKRSEMDEYPLKIHRGGKGVRAMSLDEKTGKIVAQLLIPPELDLMLITDDGTIIRTPADSIRLTGRVAKGVRVMRLSEGSRIVSVTATERDEDEPETQESAGTEPAGGALDFEPETAIPEEGDEI